MSIESIRNWIAGLAESGLPAAVVDGEHADILTDLYGRVRLSSESSTGGVIADVWGLADTSLPVAVADGDPVQLLLDVYGRQRMVYEDLPANAMRTEEVDPIDQKAVYETLCELTAIPSLTDDYLYVNLKGYKYDFFQLIINTVGDSVTVTTELSIQDDEPDPSLCSYEDVTLSEFLVANFTASTIVGFDDVTLAKWLRLHYVTAGGGGDGELTVYNVKSP